MSGPSVYFSWPTTFQPIPEPIPPVIPPPVGDGTLRAPFSIDKNLYNELLRPEIPIAVATTYIFAVLSFNAYNRRRNHAPWWISRLRVFRYFVVLHNVVLALFSFATFAAMWRAISVTWPGWVPEHPAASIADALCKLHGPRGMGDAATFNTTINIWEAKNPLIRLEPTGVPDSTDVGRLWNEGLGFWGWFFYVSKFYEVIDTSIILAKGKRSATLQTYHHAGAMLCMWAGIRYMSPPIWMFVFINSGIHAMMYTYFTLSALGYRVPQSLKRTLTSLQIAQFVFGASYAALHLFVQYDIPVSTSYQVVSAVEHAVSSASSAVSSFVHIATPTASTDWINLIKKLLLRAAGEEGPAERIGMMQLHQPAVTAAPKLEDNVAKVEKYIQKIYETRWRTDWTRINCIDTTGEAFAIYLNLLYLAPLTWLFARFFIKAYTQRGRPRTASQAANNAVESARQAKRSTGERIDRTGRKVEEELAKRESQAESKGKDLREQVRKDVQAVREGTFSSTTTQRISESISQAGTAVENVVTQAKGEVQNIATQVKEEVQKMTSSYEESSSSQMFSSSTEDVKADNPSTPPENQPGSKSDRPLPRPEIRTPPQTKPPQRSPGGGLFRSPGVSDFDDNSDDGAAAEPVSSRDDVFSTTETSESTRTTGGTETTSFSSTTTRTSESTSYEASQDESSSKQDTNLQTSKAIRQGPTDAESSAALPKREQDDLLSSSQPLRPDPEDDTDAMGRSGVDVSNSPSNSSSGKGSAKKKKNKGGRS